MRHDSDLFATDSESSLCFQISLSPVLACLVEELPQCLVALPLVADLGGGHAAGAGADVG